MKLLFFSILFLIVFLIIVISFIVRRMYRFIPGRAEERNAKATDGGELIFINGYQVWVKIYGADKKTMPYFVIPGGMGMKSSYLEENLKFIGETNPIIFYDPRGCGRSQSKPDLENYIWSRMADELNEIINLYYKVKEVGLIAHSCGSVLLYTFLVEYPDKAGKIVILSGMPVKFEMNPPDFKLLLMSNPPKEPYEANKWFSGFIRTKVMFGSMFYDKRNIEQLDTSDTSMVLFTNINVNINKPYDYSSRFKNYAKPVLIICGRDEYESVSTNRNCAGKIACEFPNMKIRFFDKSGHFPFIEEKENFCNIMSSFIDGQYDERSNNELQH